MMAQKLPLEIRHQVIRAACEMKLKNTNCIAQNIQTLNQSLAEITRPMMTEFSKERDYEFQNICRLALNDLNENIFDVMTGVYANNEELHD